MRFHTVIIFILCCFSISAKAADSVRLRRVDGNLPKHQFFKIGTFGGLGFGYSEIAHRESIELNFQGGVIYNHYFSTGLYVNSFFTLSPVIDRTLGNEAGLTGFYGGVFAMPIIYSASTVHFTVPVFVGYGGVNYELYGTDNAANKIEDSGQFWVFEPGIEIELNILKFIRVAIGGYYRYTSKIRLYNELSGEPVLQDTFLRNFSLGVKLRFGKF
jgi:hypothetical protein